MRTKLLIPLFLFLVCFISSVEAPAGKAKLKVYYAHPLSLYDTTLEKSDIDTLTALGFKVINPNDPSIERKFQKSQNFGIFLDLVRSSDAIAFRSFAGGEISSGVVSEIRIASELNLPVIELPTMISERALTQEQTIKLLDDSGTTRHCAEVLSTKFPL